MSKHIKRETPPKEKLILNSEVCCANCKEVVATQTKRFMCDTCYKMWMRTGVLRKSRAICRICGGKVTGGQHIRHGICKDCVVVRKKHSARFTKEYAVIWESKLSGRLSRMDQSEKNYETHYLSFYMDSMYSATAIRVHPCRKQSYRAAKKAPKSSGNYRH